MTDYRRNVKLSQFGGSHTTGASTTGTYTSGALTFNLDYNDNDTLDIGIVTNNNVSSSDYVSVTPTNCKIDNSTSAQSIQGGDVFTISRSGVGSYKAELEITKKTGGTAQNPTYTVSTAEVNGTFIDDIPNAFPFTNLANVSTGSVHYDYVIMQGFTGSLTISRTSGSILFAVSSGKRFENRPLCSKHAERKANPYFSKSVQTNCPKKHHLIRNANCKQIKVK